jgi:NAD(P)H-dependent FMN reductase
MSLKIALLYGSVREKRQGINVAKYVQNKLEERGHQVFFIDPKVYDLPLLDKMYKEYSEDDVPESLATLAKIYVDVDAFVIVSGEYNNSVPPALKNLIDHFLKEYFWRPSGIVTYSARGFGGVRAAMALRPILGEVGMPSIPSVFSVSKVQTSISEDGRDIEGNYDRRIVKFLDELEWYAQALKAQRKKGTPY